MADSKQPVILVVEDEPDLAELYKRWLASDYDVRWAETGEKALSQLTEMVDVVLLDRMLPGMSGAEVLNEIRARDVDCQVAMVTAVDPGFDIIEMGFDEYIAKPPTKEQLQSTVKRLLQRATLADDLQEYYSLVARRAALETEFSASRLEGDEQYTELAERIETHRAAVDETLGDLRSDAHFIGAIRAIMGEPDEPDSSDDGESPESQN